MNREPALDQARQYYELLYQRPDELVNTVEESGPKYPLDAYLTALSLSYKWVSDKLLETKANNNLDLWEK